MKRGIGKILYLLSLSMLFMFSGCRSSKQVAHKDASADITVKQIMQMPAFKPVANSVTAKMHLSAALGSSSFNAGGTIKMEQGAGIQMGITALGLFELARLEVSPFDVQFLSKMSKEYAALSYTDIGFLRQAGLSYKILEAVFMNELFSYNDMSLENAVRNMKITTSGEEIVLTTPNENGMLYRFFLDRNNGVLVRTEGTYNNTVSVVCDYRKFEQVGERLFPRVISIAVTGTDKNITLDIELSSIKTDTFRFKRSNTSAYNKIDISDLIKRLGK